MYPTFRKDLELLSLYLSLSRFLRNGNGDILSLCFSEIIM